MPYARNVELVVAAVLQLPDVRKAIADDGILYEDRVRSDILQRQDKAWIEVDSLIKSHDALEQQIGELQSRFLSLEKQAPPIIGILRQAALILGAIAASAGVLAWLAARVWQWDPLSWVVFTWASLDPTIRNIVISVPVVLIGLYAFTQFRWRTIWLPERQAKFAKDNKLADLEKSLEDSKSTLDQRVAEAFRRIANEVINESGTDLFQTQLYVPQEGAVPPPGNPRQTSGDGLSEVLNPVNEVATETRHDIARLIALLPGASIGVAGPRGVGKSTLLWSLCSAPVKMNDDKETIAIYSMAPVEYDAREFLLHLFATLCRQVLAGKKIGVEPWPRVMEEDNTDIVGAIARQGRFALLVLTAGGVMLLTGILIALVTALTQSAEIKNLLTAIDLKPGPIFQWGLIALSVGAASLLFGMRRATPSAAKDEYPPVIKQLIDRCRNTLDEIDYQRTYTAGWSGALKIPAGLETGTSGQRQSARRQLSLPDLVQQFRNFVTFVAQNNHGDGARKTRVIVAIDELDKIASAEQAQQFINEIKAIFNIPFCFYIISVSENALSNFARRGLPIRDAFDSAFDDIRNVDYFALRNSRKLLFRRTLNLPIPFVCLCHTLSGGLPRDLIRVTRALLERARLAPTGVPLEEAVAAVVGDEVRLKLRATMIAAREIALEPEVARFTVEMAALQAFDLDAPDIFEKARICAGKTRSNLSDDEKSSMRQLSDLYRQLDAFLYFAATTVALFKIKRDDEGWQADHADQGLFDQLGEARQALELSPGIATYRLDTLRASRNMPPRKPCPEQLQAAQPAEST